MSRSRPLAALSAVLVLAHVSAAQAQAQAQPPLRPLPPRVIPGAVKPVPRPPAPQVKRVVTPTSPRSYRPQRQASGPLATIGRANAQARDWPTPTAYVNSAIYYDFEPGRLYTVQASPRFLTTIALKPGEKLISKAAGDTVRWVLGETLAGAGDAAQVIVFLKPIRPDLHTNIVLTTDQRTYLIDAVSGSSAAYTSVITWNYPQDQARAAAAAQAHAALEAGAAVASDLALERLDFRYRVEPVRSRPPRWQPLRVFDDGAKTFIAFPDTLAVTEAPPLFLVGPKGRAELVNYRVSGGYYVVDRLIEVAELRLGEGRQTVVRITHTGPRP